MPNVGPLELVVVLVIALIVLGPKRLPEVGRSLGSGIREFKDSLSNLGNRDDDEDDDEVRRLAEAHPPEAVATTAAATPADAGADGETDARKDSPSES